MATARAPKATKNLPFDLGDRVTFNTHHMINLHTLIQDKRMQILRFRFTNFEYFQRRAQVNNLSPVRRIRQRCTESIIQDEMNIGTRSRRPGEQLLESLLQACLSLSCPQTCALACLPRILEASPLCGPRLG